MYQGHEFPTTPTLSDFEFQSLQALPCSQVSFLFSFSFFKMNGMSHVYTSNCMIFLVDQLGIWFQIKASFFICFVCSLFLFLNSLLSSLGYVVDHFFLFIYFFKSFFDHVLAFCFFLCLVIFTSDISRLCSVFVMHMHNLWFEFEPSLMLLRTCWLCFGYGDVLSHVFFI